MGGCSAIPEAFVRIVREHGGSVELNRPSPTTPLANLFLVGSDVGRDNIGSELAAESALRLADLLASHAAAG